MSIAAAPPSSLPDPKYLRLLSSFEHGLVRCRGGHVFLPRAVVRQPARVLRAFRARVHQRLSRAELGGKSVVLKEG